MNIEIDYNPMPNKCYFISVSLSDKEAISFDWTVKGQRIIKQILIEKKPFPKEEEISGEWDALVFEDQKFIKKYHIRWIDMGDRDWVNDEIWETVLECPIPEELKNKLLNYSRMISDRYEQVDLIKNEIEEFETLLKFEIDKFIKIPPTEKP